MVRWTVMTMAVVAVSCSSNPPSATDSGQPVTCDAPNTLCGAVCSTLKADDANCGACGSACPAEQACAGGVCYPRSCGTMTCSSAQVCVDSACVDRSCFGVVCPGSQACAGGACYPVECNGVPCETSQVCVSAVCVPAACVGITCPAGLVCARGSCVTDTCNDGMKSGTETDGDCGGICSPCADGKGCAVGGDCQSRVCTNGRCAAPSCTDGVRNGDEGAIDCGGSCEKCTVGSHCAVGSDCQSGVCTASRCVAPTCNDTVSNGTETGVDCGGTCPACANGQSCVVAADCTSALCTMGKCVSATCQNGMKDNGETDLDCGGACAGCGTAKTCAVGGDCQSGLCDASKKCAAPSCSDGRQNGFETDVDCGGTCTACAAGFKCAAAPDCASKVCTAGVCRAASCTDQVINGGETDKDCGGSNTCPRCAEGAVCLVGTDCQSAGCASNKCTQVPLLGAPLQLSAGTGPRDVAVADLDGDGHDDVVVANMNSFDVTINWGVGNGTFVSTPALSVSGVGGGPSTLVLTDLNGDGKKDIVTGRAMTGPGGWGGCRVTVITNAGGRNFLSATDYDHFHGHWSGCGAGTVVGNLNGDPWPDVAVGDEEFGSYVSDPDNRAGYFWLGTPDGGFGASGELAASGPWVAGADFNRDGLMDLVGHSVNRGNASVFMSAMGIGPGMVGTTAQYPSTNPSLTVGVSAGAGVVITGLVNNDVNADFISAGQSSNRVSVALGVGNGTFLSPASYTVNNPYGLALSDVTRDGIADLVVGSTGVAVLGGASDGTFGDAGYYQTAMGQVGRLAVGDFNGDGKPDVAAVAGGKAWALLNLSP